MYNYRAQLMDCVCISGVRISRVSHRYHSTDAVWNIGLTQEIPAPAYLTTHINLPLWTSRRQPSCVHWYACLDPGGWRSLTFGHEIIRWHYLKHFALQKRNLYNASFNKFPPPRRLLLLTAWIDNVCLRLRKSERGATPKYITWPSDIAAPCWIGPYSYVHSIKMA